MSLIAFALIFGSVSLHAAWNLMAKKDHITRPFYMLMTSMEIIMFRHVIFWTPVRYSELPVSFWFWALCSAACDGAIYCTGLLKTYELAEMSVSYPMMRSLPVIFTPIVTTLFGLGHPISLLAGIGMLVVVIGCLMMPLAKFSDFRFSNYKGKVFFFIILTALGTTGYTISDSLAMGTLAQYQGETSSIMRSMAYYAIRGFMLPTILLMICLANRKDRRILKDLLRQRTWSPFLAGAFAVGAYTLVLMAMNHVTNVSYVQVFRQMGLPVGMVAGILFLKERCTLPKFTGVLLILLGLLLTVIRF